MNPVCVITKCYSDNKIKNYLAPSTVYNTNVQSDLQGRAEFWGPIGRPKRRWEADTTRQAMDV